MATFNKRNHDNKALLVGFALILIVVLFAFIKPAFEKNKSNKNLKSASQEKTISYPQISFSELQGKIKNKEKLTILDLRNRDYYGSEHITDSVNIPFEELEQSQISAGTSDLIVILGQGLDEEKIIESQAVKIINSKGFKNVKALAGGMIAWKNNNGQAISWGDPNSFVDHSKVTFISADDLKKYAENSAYAFILDVRSSAKFLEGHVRNAANIPLDQLEQKRDEIPNSKIIAVYGDTELQAFQAGVRLYDMNFYSVQAMQGGFAAWQDKKFEVVK